MSTSTGSTKVDGEKRQSRIDSSMPPPPAPASNNKKHEAPPTPDAHSAPMTLPTNGMRKADVDEKEDIIAQLKKRLEALEKEVDAGKATAKSPDSSSKNDESKPSDSSDNKDAATTTAKEDTDKVDREQEVGIHFVEGDTEYRKIKNKTGVTKGPVLLVFSNPRGFGTGPQGDVQVASDAKEVLPYRLAIQSHCLLKELHKVTKLLILRRNVFLRPFKLLIQWEDAIRKDWDRMLADEEINEYDASLPPAEEWSEDEAAAESPEADVPSATEPEEAAVVKRHRLRDHFRLLIDFMDHQMSDIYQLRKEIDLGTRTEILFEDLWHVFRPGQIVVSRKKADGSQRAYRVLQVVGGRTMMNINGIWSIDQKIDPLLFSIMPDQPPTDVKKTLPFKNRMTPLQIDLCYTDFDGAFYGPKSARLVILEYPGVKSITSFELYPLQYEADPEKTKQDLLARGDKYVRCAKAKHMNYKGRNMLDRFTETEAQDLEEINCEVVIDPKHYLQDTFEFGDDLISKATDVDDREFGDNVTCGIENCDTCTDLFWDADVDLEGRECSCDEKIGRELLQVTDTPTDNHKMLLPLRLFGYALADRNWHALNVNHFSPIKRDLAGEAFKDLVLSYEHKTIIQALVKNQIRRFSNPSGSHDHDRANSSPVSLDLIRGKGLGLVILLHGVPGVGKTSTAEAVASQLQRPLFPITCGDLGTEPPEVERKLREYFKLAQRWGCVLLLDEADVFLARRNAGEYIRNGLVAVFLRALEYYSGVLILTTNRPGELDEAFRSRVHVSLRYSDLNEDSTKQIWELNLNKVKQSRANGDLDIDIQEDGIRAFYQELWKSSEKNKSARWNGRQIKNAFQSAVAMANWKFYETKSKEPKGPRPVLTRDQFDFVAKITADFDKYLNFVHKATPEEGAYAQQAQNARLRNDNYVSGVTDTPTPDNRARGARNGTPAAAGPDTSSENAVQIEKLKRQLKFYQNHPKMSEDQKVAKMMELEFEISELGGSTDDAAAGAKDQDGDESVPW